MKQCFVLVILLVAFKLQAQVDHVDLMVTDYTGSGCKSILLSKETLASYQEVYDSYEERYEKAEGDEKKQARYKKRMESWQLLIDSEREGLELAARRESVVFKFRMNEPYTISGEKLRTEFGSWKIALSQVDQDGNHFVDEGLSYQAIAYGDVVCDYLEGGLNMKNAARKAFDQLFE